MIEQLFNFIRAWIRGDDAEMNVEFRLVITWVDLAFTILLAALIIWLWR